MNYKQRLKEWLLIMWTGLNPVTGKLLTGYRPDKIGMMLKGNDKGVNIIKCV